MFEYENSLVTRVVLAVSTFVTLSSAWLVIQWCRRFQKHRWYGKHHGCRPPQHVRKAKIVGGFDLTWRMVKADKACKFPDELLKIYNEQGNERRHGVVNTWLEYQLGKPVVYTVDCSNIKAVCATQVADYGVGDLRKKIYGPFIGKGIFALDGKDWEHTRGMLRPAFSRDHLSDLDLEERHVQDLLNVLKTDSSGWTPSVDLQPLLLRLTIDTATEFLFGRSLDSQKLAGATTATAAYPLLALNSGSDLASAFDGAMEGLGDRMRLGEFYFCHRSPEWKRQIKLLHDFTDHYVHQALTTYSNASTEKGTTKKRLLNDMVETCKDAKVLREQVLTIIAAGRDTTAGLLGWTLWLLSRNPQEYQKLRSVILDTFGSFSDPHITFETLKRCSHLQFTLNEAGRLYPVVPLNQRRSLRDSTLPAGGGPDGKSPLFVEKGTEVMIPHHVLHRRRDLWGEDADEFRPARWQNRRFAWDFVPFSAGARICLGQQLALTEAAYVLVRLVQRFDALESTDPAGNEAFHTFTVTTTPKHLYVKLHEQQDDSPGTH